VVSRLVLEDLMLWLHAK